jgi:hypothetical protein
MQTLKNLISYSNACPWIGNSMTWYARAFEEAIALK